MNSASSLPPSPTPPPLGIPRSAAPRLEAQKPHPDSSGSPPPPLAENPHPGLTPSTLHRAPVGQGPSGPDWLAISLGFWSGRVLATGTAWAGLCLIHHHHHHHHHHPLGSRPLKHTSSG